MLNKHSVLVIKLLYWLVSAQSGLPLPWHVTAFKGFKVYYSNLNLLQRTKDLDDDNLVLVFAVPKHG